MAVDGTRNDSIAAFVTTGVSVEDCVIECDGGSASLRFRSSLIWRDLKGNGTVGFSEFRWFAVTVSSF